MICSKSHNCTPFTLAMDDFPPCTCCSPMQQASMALLESHFEKAGSKYDFPCPHCGAENPMVAYTPDYTGYHGTCNKCWQEITSPAGSTRYVSKGEKPFHGYNPNKHSRKGGLNAKGRAKFKREEGANLKPPVTTKPSKLKAGSKKAKRRKSFCARMGGAKGPTSKGGKLTPKGAALKRWNC